MDDENNGPPEGSSVSWESLNALYDATWADLIPIRPDPNGPMKFRIKRLLACPTCSSHRAAIHSVQVAPIASSPSFVPLRKVVVAATDAQCRHHNGGPASQPGVVLLCACEEGHEFQLRFTLFTDKGSTTVETLPGPYPPDSPAEGHQ
jgi:hypothetical protein